MKKYYKATARVTNGERTWDIGIYSMYKTLEEAQEGVERFKENYANTFIRVLKTWIE